MEGNIYKLKGYVHSGMYDSNKYYIITEINYFIDMYAVVEVSLNDNKTTEVNVPMLDLKRLFDLEFDAFMNNWKFNAAKLEYSGIYSNDALPWNQMINYKKQCSHIWTKYIGFREEYEYCTKCEEKRFTKD